MAGFWVIVDAHLPVGRVIQAIFGLQAAWNMAFFIYMPVSTVVCGGF